MIIIHFGVLEHTKPLRGSGRGSPDHVCASDVAHASRRSKKLRSQCSHAYGTLAPPGAFMSCAGQRFCQQNF